MGNAPGSGKRGFRNGDTRLAIFSARNLWKTKSGFAKLPPHYGEY
jgi:hypothetical protein